MRKFLFLILFALAAVIALLFYQQYLIATYPPNEEKTSAVTTTVLIETTTAATISVIETTTVAETTKVTEETESMMETSTAADAVSTAVSAETQPAVMPPKLAGEINPLIKALELEFPENALAILINAPDEEILKKAGEYGRFTSSQAEPPSLIIPIYIGSTLTINEIAGITESGELIYGERLITDPDIGDNYCLLFEAIRPEGLPSYAIEINFEDKTSVYAYAYDGRDGNTGIEYFLIEEEIEALG